MNILYQGVAQLKSLASLHIPCESVHITADFTSLCSAFYEFTNSCRVSVGTPSALLAGKYTRDSLQFGCSTEGFEMIAVDLFSPKREYISQGDKSRGETYVFPIHYRALWSDCITVAGSVFAELSCPLPCCGIDFELLQLHTPRRDMGKQRTASGPAMGTSYCHESRIRMHSRC